MALVLHITTREQWWQAKQAGVYRGDTLDSQGFIHCSTPAQVIKVANALFGDEPNLVLLCIDSEKVQAEIRYEAAYEGAEELYPHIYGPLNMDAVVKVLDVEPSEDGTFEFPDGINDERTGIL